MTSSNSKEYPNLDDFPEIVSVIARCCKYIDDESRLSVTVNKSLQLITLITPYLRYAQVGLKSIDKEESAQKLERIITMVDEEVGFAEKEHDKNYDTLNRHGIVSMWGALEACFEDVVVTLLLKDDLVLSSLASRGIYKGKQPKDGITENVARKIYRKVEQSRPKKTSIGAWYEKIINAAGIKLFISSNDEMLLSRSKVIRDCILHRGGKIDSLAVSKEPSLKQLQGKQVELTRNDFLDYMNATRNFLNSLLEGVANSRHLR